MTNIYYNYSKPDVVLQELFTCKQIFILKKSICHLIMEIELNVDVTR